MISGSTRPGGPCRIGCNECVVPETSKCSAISSLLISIFFMARICSVRQIQKCYQAFYQTKITVCRYSYKLYLDEYSVQYRITVIYCDYIQCIWRHSNVKMCRHREGIFPACVRGSRYRRNSRPKRGSAFLLFASVVSVVRRSS